MGKRLRTFGNSPSRSREVVRRVPAAKPIMPSPIPPRDNATVTAPAINLGAVIVGEDLQASHSASLSVAPPSATEVTVSVASTSTALLSTAEGTVGSGSVTFSGVTATSSLRFYVQGVAKGSTTLTVSTPGYAPRTVDVDVTGSGFHLATGNFSTTTFSANTTVNVDLYALSGTGNLYTTQGLRPGVDVQVELASSDPTVGVLTATTPHAKFEVIVTIETDTSATVPGPKVILRKIVARS